MSIEFEVDLEKGVLESPEKPGIVPVKTGEEAVGTPGKPSPVRETDKPGCGRSGRKEKRKKSASKPPRPPRGPSLDAADQKLIKEIAELAMLKRARIERMRALKRMKAAKAASAASSLGNVFATVFTLIFCFVIILQGMSSKAASGSFGKSPSSATLRVNRDGVSVGYMGNPSPSEPNRLYTGPDVAHSGLPKHGVSLLRSNRKMSLRFLRNN